MNGKIPLMQEANTKLSKNKRGGCHKGNPHGDPILSGRRSVSTVPSRFLPSLGVCGHPGYALTVRDVPSVPHTR